MKWVRQFIHVLTRNWREKLVALVLAIVFWYMIKSQVRRPSIPWTPPPGPVATLPTL